MPTQEQLKEYANVLLTIGLNVQKGQPVAIGSPIEAADFVHILTEQAYEIGASTVHIEWADPLIKRIRMEKEEEQYLEQVPPWSMQRMQELIDQNAAFLMIAAEDPDLLAGIDQRRIGIADKAFQTAYKPIRQNFMEDRVTWLVCSLPTKAWAQKIYPNVAANEAVAKLWEVMLTIMRIDQENPVQAWRDHLARLEHRAKFLNEKRVKKLQYRATGTDLTIELPDGHIWMAAGSQNAKGAHFVANLPTEEVYTLPKRDGIDGTVRSTKPLVYNGIVIEGIELKFERGRIVSYQASAGYEALKELIETDEGSHFLGEVALVPVNSPIAESNTLFYNTLFDENASCHLAIGQAYPTCLQGGVAMSAEERLAAGANDSITHEDFMVGSDDMDIDGILADGSVLPIFRQGKFVI